MYSSNMDSIQAMNVYVKRLKEVRLKEVSRNLSESNAFENEPMATDHSSGSSTSRMKPPTLSKADTPPKKRLPYITMANCITKIAKASVDQDAKTGKTTSSKIQEIFNLCMGKPTFAPPKEMSTAGLAYWLEVYKKTIKANRSRDIAKKTSLHKSPSSFSDAETQQIIESGAAIDYTNPKGDREACAMLAKAISGQHRAVNIESPKPLPEPKDKGSTNGASHALSLIFNTLDSLFPNDRKCNTNMEEELQYIQVVSDNSIYMLTPWIIRNALKSETGITFRDPTKKMINIRDQAKTGLKARKTIPQKPPSSFSDAETQQIIESGAAIDYTNPKGDPEACATLAKAVSNQHQGYEVKPSTPLVEPEHVVFTNGASYALRLIFNALHSLFPEESILMANPYYTLYKHTKNPRIYIDVMSENPSYRLTPQSIRKALEQAKSQNVRVCALLICDPNNPTGTVIKPDEWKEIGLILKENPGLYLVHDAAYAFMLHSGDRYQSLLTVAPELKIKERLIILYSGTKSFSGSAERLAAAIIFDQNIRRHCVDEISNILGGAVKSCQNIFAETMKNVSRSYLKRSCNFYKEQVDIVLACIEKLHIGMPSTSYRPEGTFYVLCQLKELYDQPLDANVVKLFRLSEGAKAKTDEQVAYNLIHQDGVAMAPLSYFGAPPEACYFRITCSIGKKVLVQVMRRIAKRLSIVRNKEQFHLLQKLRSEMTQAEYSQKVFAIIPSDPKMSSSVEERHDAIASAELLYRQNKELVELLAKNRSSKQSFNRNIYLDDETSYDERTVEESDGSPPLSPPSPCINSATTVSRRGECGSNSSFPLTMR